MSVALAPRPVPASSAGTTVAAEPASRVAAVLAVLVVLAAIIVAPPWRAGTVPPGTAVLLDGYLELIDGGRVGQVAIGDEVPSGATVRTDIDDARLAITDGTLTMAARTQLVVGAPFALDFGHVLLEADRVTAVTTTPDAGGAEVAGRGSWRVDAGASPRVAVYAGGVGVTNLARQERSLGRFEEATLDGGQLGTELPIRYLWADPWDARLLAGAIAVDQQVERLQGSLRATYGAGVRPGVFFTGFAAVEGALGDGLGRLSPRTSELGFGPTPEVLTAVIVVELLRTRAALSTVDAIAEVADRRAAGATWGLILAVHDLGAEDLRAATDAALRRRAVEALASPQPVAPSTPTTTPGSPTSPEPSPTPGPVDPTTVPPTDPPVDPPGGDGPVGSVLEPVDGVLGDLAELLDPILPGSGAVIEDGSEVVGGAGDTLDDLIGGGADAPTVGGAPELLTDLVPGLG